MAITYSPSPRIKFTEDDQSYFNEVVETVPTLGTVAALNWGAFDEAITIINENNTLKPLTDAIGKPMQGNSLNTIRDYVSIHNATTYAKRVEVVRSFADGYLNATSARDGGNPNNIPGPNATLIKNKNDFDTQYFSGNLPDVAFIARYAGAMGNGLGVHIVQANNYNSVPVQITSKYMPYAPNTSMYGASLGKENDEFHLYVSDDSGKITGNQGEVLEVFTFLGTATDSRNGYNEPSYYVDIINSKSKYIYATGILLRADLVNGIHPSSNFGGLTKDVVSGAFDTVIPNYVLDGGANSVDESTDEQLQSAWNVFLNRDMSTARYLFINSISQPTYTNVIRYIVENVATIENSLHLFASVPLTTFTSGYDNANILASITDFINTDLNLGAYNTVSVDSAHKITISPFDGSKVVIPCASDSAGLFARVETNIGIGNSAAGYENGVIKNCVDLLWSTPPSMIADLDKLRINPIIRTKGKGVVLFGDCTIQKRSSTLSDIPARLLLNRIKERVVEPSQAVLFKFNNFDTRSNFKRSIEQVLKEYITNQVLGSGSFVRVEGLNVDGDKTFNAEIYVQFYGSIKGVNVTFKAVNNTFVFTETQV